MNVEYVQLEGYLELIRSQGVCCITDQPLAESQIRVVLLQTFAGWAFPVWNDFSLGTNAKAMAFVSDQACTPEGLPIGTIKNAIEVKDGTLIYHPVNETIYHGTLPIDTPPA